MLSKYCFFQVNNINFLKSFLLVASFPWHHFFIFCVISESVLNCATFQKGSNGQLLWVRKVDFRIPSEEELRRILSPENVSYLCSSLFGNIFWSKVEIYLLVSIIEFIFRSFPSFVLKWICNFICL